MALRHKSKRKPLFSLDALTGEPDGRLLAEEVIQTEEEKRLIDEKMAQLPTRRYGAYLRKMAIDGYIIQLDTTDIKRMNAALSAIGRNINQIAKRVNAGGGA